jgi:hypothetical protein
MAAVERSAHLPLHDVLADRSARLDAEGGLTVLNQEFDWHDDNGKGAKNH